MAHHEVNRGCGRFAALSVSCITQSNVHLATMDSQNRDGIEVARLYGPRALPKETSLC